MQEHPVPRQITTFEFKLIGELTIKQFGYLAFGAVFGVILFFLIPNIFLLNFIVAAVPVAIGIGFAFVPINERPLDIWLKNLFKRLTSPTQYYFKKNNLPPKILLGITLPPREVLIEHIKAQQKLNEYLEKKPREDLKDKLEDIDQSFEQKKSKLQSLMFASPTTEGTEEKRVSPTTSNINENLVSGIKVNPDLHNDRLESNFTTINIGSKEVNNSSSVITVSGVVLSSGGVPLGNILVYIKKGIETVRLFKTASNGIFQNNLPLPKGDYFIELEDPKKKYHFAKMKLNESAENIKIFAL